MKILIAHNSREFNLTEEEIILSKRIFKGKIVQFILTNGFHVIPEQGNYKFLRYPENDLSLNEFYEFYDNLVESTSAYKILILSNSLILLTGIPTSLVRIATENGIEIPKFENNTFCGNIGEIQVNAMGGKWVLSHASRFVKELMERVEAYNLNPDPSKLEDINQDVSLIGEEIIKFQFTKLLKLHQ